MIRWPRDPLIFSVRVRGCGVYAAGYVEGDTSAQEILAARTTTQGLELVSLRGARETAIPDELNALRSLKADGVARVLDAFTAHGSLQPTSSSSLGDGYHGLVIVERLPADVHLGDLSRMLFRRRHDVLGRPPVGLALFVVRELARIYASTPASSLPGDELTSLVLSRRADIALLGWDGSVWVQPRVVPARERRGRRKESADDVVIACGHHLLRLLSAEAIDAQPHNDDDQARLLQEMREHAQEIPDDVPRAVQELVQACVLSSTDTIPLAHVAQRLDELLVDEPFSRDDLAGTLAQLFPEERAQDLAFREELGTCDLDALTLPEVRATSV